MSRLLQQALFEVDTADPLIYLAAAAVLLLVAEFASWLPVRRATGIHPVIALRAQRSTLALVGATVDLEQALRQRVARGADAPQPGGVAPGMRNRGRSLGRPTAVR